MKRNVRKITKRRSFQWVEIVGWGRCGEDIKGENGGT